MDGLPEWMWPPRAEGWVAEDLDTLVEAPKHTELIDGVLVFRQPLRVWHNAIRTQLQQALIEQAPHAADVAWGMTIRLDEYSRTEPDLLVTTAPLDFDRTWFAPEDVLLVIEVISAESAHRDRTVKLRKYAEAGIPHYWIVEEENSAPVVHVYELDGPTKAYAPAGIVRGVLDRPVPFPLRVDLDSLIPRRP
ncbi:Uma2 family endonuclease [Allokutzneria sp. NRRL B-24872]|uniref:Uma2 family endonuclease n=1 Tax=Allokutzneria sp. NRRL B-24872 TaxID=1137961 RepID=UPI000A37E5CC|nr:Uma2 family endonuclease [Allokutzneria sp. NRRL B-24872]